MRRALQVSKSVQQWVVSRFATSSLRQTDTAQQVGEARIASQRVESGIHPDSR